MIVTEMDIFPCVLQFEDKEWKFALATVTASSGWIVRVKSDDGHAGYGYAPAIAHMGSTFEGLPIELARLKPLVVGQDPHAIETILMSFEASLWGASQAKAAIDCALHDLVARAVGSPLYDLLGGRVRDRIPVLRILSIQSAEQMAQQAERLANQGYSYFKIKVHGNVEEDVAAVRAIRQRVGPAAHLTIDANQSYSVKDAIYAIQRMAEFNLDLVEQPVSRHDLKGLEQVTRSTPVAVEADEGAGTIEEIMALASNRIVDAVSLKLPKLGGIRNAIAAARICEAAGVRYRLGAHVGTRLLNAHALHVAAALPKMTYACEIGEFARMFGDPFAGIEVVDGEIKVPHSVGCGVDPISPLRAAP
jgi:L-alanine-DL-glutamate epimerase-like enolase superfamily enzyme